MAISSEHLPMDSTSEQWTLERHLLTVQAAIINQIAQVTHGKWILDEVLHLIALQLRDALQVTDCLIFQTETSQQISAFDAHSVSAHASSKGAALKSLSVSVGTAQQEGRDVSQARLYSVCSEFCQYYHSKLAEGKSVTIPRGEPRLPLALQNLARKFNLCTILIVPLLHRQSYLGAITLYQCEQEREWLPQEIACVQAIAAHCAIALTLAELEQRYETELKDRQESSAKNRALLKAIPDLIFRVSRDGIYFDFQAAKEDALPIPASEMIGRHLHQVLPTEVAGLIWHHVELALETNEMQFVEYQLWLNGKSRNFEARLVKSGSDEVTVIVQDITERVQARVTLEQVNDALEIRVAERTAALKEANYVLRAEIIERKRAEKQLRESEERFRNLVETSSDWVWEVDENAVYTYTSPKVKSLLGYEPLEVLGKTPFDLMPPSERQRVAEIWNPIAASRQPFTCIENTNIHKDGHSVILERSGVPIFDAKGSFCGYRGIDRDISERKRVEKEVRFLHSITQAIFESQDFHAALSVALQKVCEATGWDFGEAWVPRPDGSVLECSPAWFSKTESLLPFRSASDKLTFARGSGLPGRVWISQQPEWRPDVSAESNQIYLRAQIAREVGLKAGLGIPLLTPNGVLAVLVFYMFESREEDQQLIELICASTELGLMIQRKQAEGDIRKALVREKELTELKSRFISMTSHEFRTPLTTIQSSAELLEHYSQKWTEERKLTHLYRIQTSVKHMTRLLNDVLIIGKAEAGNISLNPAPLDLEDFCRNLVDELQFNDNKQHIINFSIRQGIGERKGLEDRDWGLGERKGVGVRDWGLGEENSLSNSEDLEDSSSTSPMPQSRRPAKLPCMDEKLLRQILENLLSNGIKYSPAGSTIEFTLRFANDRAIFEIRDRGIGIPAEEQHRLFETFHRATNVGTIPGTGLGLAIVKKCVDIHQGQIVVESKVGVGTTFTVTLPIYN